jgi:hypothetical protein
VDARLPAHLEVAGLIRSVQAAGGFATVIAKGERDAGTLLVVCCEKGANATAYERMPQPDGTRSWSLARKQNVDDPKEFWDYCDRRRRQDGDLWVIELDVPKGERFIV